MYSLITGKLVLFRGVVVGLAGVIRALSFTNNLHLSPTHTRTHPFHLLVLLLNVFLLQNKKKQFWTH